MKKPFPLVVTGGTFDRLHKGHEALLSTAFKVARRVVIGVTSPAMVRREKKVLPLVVQSYAQRVSNVRAFLKRFGLLKRARIVKLNDVHGPARCGKNIGAVVATSETRKGAVEINWLRKKKGLQKLQIVLCPFVCSQDKRHISSKRIRLGQSDRKGRLYARELEAKAFLLTDFVIPRLRTPLGQLLKGDGARRAARFIEKENPTRIVAVGDIAVKNLSEASVRVDVAVADLKTRRKKVFSSTEELVFKGQEVRVRNRPSRISASLVRALKKALKGKRKTLVRVFGEEDLAVLPAVLLAPLNSFVFYGQIDKGLVLVRVTEESKQKVLGLLRSFRKRTR
ncbi:MAG: pantetheine-phosphate adenylyltransferase [Candidatus Micrarchaeia archaeon]